MRTFLQRTQPLFFLTKGRCLVFAVIWSWLGAVHGFQTNDPVDFVKTLKPIIEAKCFSCHGPDNDEGGLRFDDSSTVLSEIEPGKASESHLFELLTASDETELMPPPDEKNPLTAEEIKQFEDWINQGAHWPENLTWVATSEKRSEDAQTNNVGQTSTETPANQSEQSVAPPNDQTKKSGEQDKAAEPDKAEAPTSLGERIWLALGSLHPASTHLPIGLLLAAGIFSLLGLRGNFVMSDSAYYCLWLGTITALFAAVLGWAQGMERGATGEFNELYTTTSKYFAHRLSGTAVAVASLMLALYAARARALDPDDGFLWKLGAILLALGVSYCGYEGGKITHGSNHYKKLFSATEEVTGWELDGKANGPKPIESATPEGTKETKSDETNESPKPTKDSVGANENRNESAKKQTAD